LCRGHAAADLIGHTLPQTGDAIAMSVTSVFEIFDGDDRADKQYNARDYQ
jgi:hypothetical protein